MKISINVSAAWVVCWLFTVGFAKLGGAAILWSFAIWAYYLGASIAPLVAR